jgi:hypothetical protein
MDFLERAPCAVLDYLDGITDRDPLLQGYLADLHPLNLHDLHTRSDQLSYPQHAHREGRR